MHFAGNARAFLFAHRLQIGSQSAQLLARITQLFFGAPAFGDVAHETREHRRAIKADFGDRQFNRKFLAVGSHGHYLDPFAQHRSLAASEEALQAAAMFVPQRGRNEDLSQFIAHDFGSGAAKDFFRGRVEFGDAPTVVDGGDGVQR